MANEKLDLIDRNALMKWLWDTVDDYSWGTRQYTADDIYNMLDDYPTVDAVVLPCKIGDVVYFPIKDYHDSAIIEKISITEQGICFEWVQYEFGVDLTECWDDGEFGIDEIGKTVFLTREEAEAALAKMDGGDGDV